MTDMVKVTISGVFPKDDVAKIADFYGGQAEQDKLKYAVDLAQKVMADFISAPSRALIEQQAAQQKQQMSQELAANIEKALTTETEEQ